MTEIERLAKEAGGEVEEYTTHMWTTAEQWCFTPDELAKFAALIAEECAKECELMKTVSGTDDVERGWNAAMRIASGAIRAKFALSHKEN